MRTSSEYDVVRVLKADPDLVKHLDARSAVVAQRHMVAPVEWLDIGPTDTLAPAAADDGDLLGYLVLEGLLVHRVCVADRSGIELLGQGDFVTPQPVDGLPLAQVADADESWEVLVPTRIAALDRDFESAALRWPGIMSELFGRAARRTTGVMLCLALAQIPGVESRLLVLMWLLADRWGTVTPDGVTLPLRISHRMLGELVSAQRPTVTRALRCLINQGALASGPDRGWILKTRRDTPELGAAWARRPARDGNSPGRVSDATGA